MLSPADDYLTHQTFEPIRYVVTSDRRYYDRYFFTGHMCDERLFFMLGMGCYPNLGVIDGFGSFALDGVQYTIRGSRELSENRMDTKGVGLLDVEVIEGLKILRFRCRDEGQDVHFDLEWNGVVPAFPEPPLHMRVLGRMIEQGTRFIQTGTWTGYITIKGERLELKPENALGARDHAWGVRSIGFEREPKGIMQAKQLNKNRTSLWIWSPMQFKDYTVHFSLSEYANEEREINHVRKMPIYNKGDISYLEGAEHDLIFDQETRELKAGSKVSFLDENGERRTVTLYPLCCAHLRAGTGYGGPEPWRHGKYMGEVWSDLVEFDLNDRDLVAKIGPTHVLCRMEMDNGEVGYGTFETQVYGAYPRYGFKE